MPHDDNLPKGFIRDAWGHQRPHRFVRAFNRARQLIPELDRDEIVDYCSKLNPAGTRITVDPERVSLGDGPSRDACAQFRCSELDCYFVFLGPVIERMPREDDVVTLIAHELAHCYLSASSGGRHLQLTYADAEAEVTTCLLQRWGFPPDAESYLRAAQAFAAARLRTDL